MLVALVVNLYPYRTGSATELLVALYLPLVLWFTVAYPYMGGTIRSHERRMDFVRFTGEWVIYYALIALGGGVLLGLTALIFEPIGTDVERVVVMLTVATATYAVSGVAGAFDRELLGVFDALLVVVLGLVVYAMSAREPSQPAGLMDRVQLLAVASALLLDVMVLGAMVAMADLLPPHLRPPSSGRRRRPPPALRLHLTDNAGSRQRGLPTTTKQVLDSTPTAGPRLGLPPTQTTNETRSSKGS